MILRDSRGVVTDVGPSRARLAGYGGSLATYTAPPPQPQVRYGDPNGARTRRNGLRGEHMLDRKRQSRYTDQPRRYTDQPRCGEPVISVNSQVLEACHRLPGHLPGHRSKAAMDAENTRRLSRARVRV